MDLRNQKVNTQQGIASQPVQINATTQANPTPTSDNAQTPLTEKPSTSKPTIQNVAEVIRPQTTTKGKEIIVLTDADTNESAEDILARQLELQVARKAIKIT